MPHSDSPSRRRFVAVAGLLALVLGLSSPADVEADGWWGDLDKGEAVSLADVFASPESFYGRDLTFHCIFKGPGRTWLPYRSTINSVRHSNFVVWADGAPLWEDEAHQRELAFLYIPNSNIHRVPLLQEEMYTRLELTGRVKHIFSGTPLIEVDSYYVTNQRLGKDVVDAMTWGDNYARAGRRWESLAVEKYKEALVPDLAPIYNPLVRKRLAEALRRVGRTADADAVAGGAFLGGSEMPEADGAPPAGLTDLPDDPFATQPDPFSTDPAAPGAVPPVDRTPLGGNLPGSSGTWTPPPVSTPGLMPTGDAPEPGSSPIGSSLPGTPAPAPSGALPAPARGPLGGNLPGQVVPSEESPAPTGLPAPTPAPSPTPTPTAYPSPAPTPTPTPSPAATPSPTPSPTPTPAQPGRAPMPAPPAGVVPSPLPPATVRDPARPGRPAQPAPAPRGATQPAPIQPAPTPPTQPAPVLPPMPTGPVPNDAPPISVPEGAPKAPPRRPRLSGVK